MATLADQPASVQKIFNDTWGNQAGSEWAAENAKNNPSSGSTSQNPQLQGALQQLQSALASGSQKEYDLALATLMGVMNGQPTLAAQQLAQSGQQFAQTEAEKAREFNLGQGQSLLDTATKLQGPADWGKYLQYTSGGKSLYDQAMTGRPASGAPVGTNQPQTLQSVMSAIGKTSAPGAAGTAAVPAAAANPATQQATFRQLMGLAPNYMPGTNYSPADVQAATPTPRLRTSLPSVGKTPRWAVAVPLVVVLWMHRRTADPRMHRTRRAATRACLIRSLKAQRRPTRTGRWICSCGTTIPRTRIPRKSQRLSGITSIRGRRTAPAAPAIRPLLNSSWAVRPLPVAAEPWAAVPIPQATRPPTGN